MKIWRRGLLLLLLQWGAHSATAQRTDRQTLDSMTVAMQLLFDRSSDSVQQCAAAALPLARRLHDGQAIMLIQRLDGLSLFLKGLSDRAASVLLAAEKEAEGFAESKEKALLYYAISQVYNKNRIRPISEQYLRKGITIARHIHNDTLTADGHNRMGIMYESRGALDSALYYYRLALAVNEQAGMLLATSNSLENIASVYNEKNELQTALAYQRMALERKIKAGTRLDIAMGMVNMGESMERLKRHDSALIYTKQALAVSREIHFKDLQKYACGLLAEISENKGDLAGALAYRKQYMALNDTMYNENITRQLAEQNAKYQAEQHEQQIRELNHMATIQGLQLRQRSILLGIAGLLMAAGTLIGYLVYNRRQLSARAALQEAMHRQQAITTREVLNAEERERRRIAADLHDGVGQLLSATLLNLNGFFGRMKVEAGDKDADRILGLVTESYDELRTISHQMMPNGLLKWGLAAAVRELIARTDSDSLAITFEASGLDGGLPEDVETVLYRVIQESVTNVIKHAGATALHLQIIKDEDGVAATIEDNGRGFDLNNSNDGIGLKNVYSRVRFLQGTVEIDTAPGRGTLIAVHIPMGERLV